MRDLLEHWDAILLFMTLLISTITIMGKIILWFVKRLLDQFSAGLEKVCRSIDKLTDNLSYLSGEVNLLKGEHNANHGKR
jgi:hypothetical protein